MALWGAFAINLFVCLFAVKRVQPFLPPPPFWAVRALTCFGSARHFLVLFFFVVDRFLMYFLFKQLLKAVQGTLLVCCEQNTVFTCFSVFFSRTVCGLICEKTIQPKCHPEQYNSGKRTVIVSSLVQLILAFSCREEWSYAFFQFKPPRVAWGDESGPVVIKVKQEYDHTEKAIKVRSVSY